MNDLQKLESEALHLVSLAKAAGADACDVVVASGESLSVSVREGKVENSNRSESDAFSLRVFCGKKVASISANRSDNPEALAERAVAMAKVSPEDEFQGLADKERLYSSEDFQAKLAALELYDDSDPTPKQMEEMALTSEKAGLGVEGISKSLGAGMGYSRSGFVLATSNGFSASHKHSGFSISASMVAGDGTLMERDYDYDSKIHLSDLRDAEEIGIAAGERTVKRMNPKQVESGMYPIVMDPRVSASILSTLTGAVNGSSIARKTSFLREKMGEKITADNISIIDDPRMVRQSGSRLCDHEGVVSEKLNLVENGILNHWLLDSATARELTLETNGRAMRSGSGTSPSSSNCYMEKGEQSPQEMIANIKDGFYLSETIGHGINMVTGDYSKGASGYWIKNGELAFPVAQITIAGNLAQMFLNMQPASDLEFKYSVNAPTLLVEGMTIGGK